MKRKNLLTAALTILALAALSAGCQGEKKAETAAPKVEPKVTVELFVMSKCPFGVKALDAMIPAIEKLGGAAALDINYIGNEGQGGALESMHGPEEVEGNLAQICAGEIAKDKHFKFITCLDKEWQTIPKNVESCAKEAGIDVAALKACKDGDKGKKLLAASYKKAAESGAQGSPTIRLAGKPYEGGRKSDDFLRGICMAFADKDRPKACSEIPEPPAVQVIAISDKRCPECETAQVLESLKSVFPGLKPTTYDWSDPAAKQIITEAAIKLLPAILFDDSMAKDKEGSEQMARWLVPAGKYKSLRIRAEFDPTAEICDNKVDDTNNGLVDCADPTCATSLICREEKLGRLDVFVMSQCPFGVQALNAVKDVLGAFGNEVKFDVHFIAEKTDAGFQSLHGPAETAENIRELCAKKYYGKNNKYMDYIWCRNENIRSEDWKPCTGKNGIATATVEKCASGPEGEALLTEDIKMAKELKIGASPTWLVNNKTTFNAIAAKDIQTKICEKNSAFKGCAKTLAEAAPNAAPAPQGGACGQ